MKLFYQLLGLILGFIIGILTATTSVAVFALWAYSDTKKKPQAGSRVRFYGPQNKSKQDPLKHEYVSRKEAEDVLDMLMELTSEYGFTTIADLKVALEMSPTFADSKKGWKTLRDVSISQAPERKLYHTPTYIISFPEPEDI